jgi:hypothetical protein
MSLTVVHPFVNPIPDEANFTGTKPSHWNAAHTVTGTVDAPMIAAIARPILTADTTINVPSQYATIQAALNYSATIDFNGHTLTIQVAGGTYTEQLLIPATVGQAAPQNLLIQGDTTTPGNVVLTWTVGFQGILLAQAAARCRIQGFKFSGSGNSHGIHAKVGSVVEFQICEFAGGCFYHRYAEGGTIFAVGNFSISAGAAAHIAAEGGGRIYDYIFAPTVTITNTPNFISAYAFFSTLSYCRVDLCTFSGSATGQRYLLDGTSVIDTKGSGATYLPGNAAGTGNTYL